MAGSRCDVKQIDLSSNVNTCDVNLSITERAHLLLKELVTERAHLLLSPPTISICRLPFREQIENEAMNCYFHYL